MKTTITSKLSTPVFAMFALVLFTSMIIKAASGDLDPTFGNRGKVTDFLSRGDDSARGVAVQADGKIVAAGSSWTGVSSDFAVARYLADGTLDASFGTDGKVTTDFDSAYDAGHSVAIQPDGRIVVAGYGGSGFDFAIVRYNPDGSLDGTFGTGGKVTTDFGSSYDQAYSVAIHTDGRIVALGISYFGGNEVFSLARYNADGSPDPQFDSDGKVTTDLSPSHELADSVAIQADGKIVAAGESYNGGSNSSFILVRYNVDGSLDSSFDEDGKVTSTLANRASAVAIEADGKIVAAGSSFNGNNRSFIVVRYNTNGSLDATAGTNTATFFPPSFIYTTADSVAIQPDGKIVATGIAVGSNNTTNFAAIRFNANFALDATFGINGIATTPIFTYATADSVAIQPDGKIVTAGGFRNVSDHDFAAVRYNSNGSLDTAFGTAGLVTTDFGFFQGNVLYDTAIQPDGKIVAVGETRADFAVLRYNADGSPDAAFGSGTGKVRTDIGSTGDTARAVAIQTDGKIVVAGGAYDWDDNQCCFALARYNPDGSLDTTFNGSGKVITGGLSSGAFDIVIQPDGKIVVAGDRWDSQSGFVVIRYNTDGSLDTSFDGDGFVTTRIDSRPYALAASLALEPGGKIVAAGYVSNNYDPNVGASDFAVVRYNKNGSLDTGFDGDGIVTTAIDSSDYAQDVAIQADGKIVVGGCTSSANVVKCDQFALARYNANGSPDTTFDGDGKAVAAIFGLNRDTHLSSIAIQPDGKIAAAGHSNNGSDNDFVLARFHTDGSPDRGFGGGDGKATADFDTSSDNAYGMALDRAGQAVVVGVSNGSFAIARFLVRVPARTFADFDGDSRADISVVRPSDGRWYIDRSSQGFSATPLGIATDQPTPADYDGDGKTDISVFRDGTWFWLNSSDGVMRQADWGIAGDTPQPADYSGDGRAELAIFRRSIRRWYIYDVAAGTVRAAIFGIGTDRLVPADYDGDGRTDLAVYRNGTWYVDPSTRPSPGGYPGIPFGISTDRPVVGDYDGDGKADQAVYRDGTWYLNRSSEGFAAFQFGVATDIPVPADYDGDGRTDLAVYRDGTWHISKSSGGFAAVPFGVSADKPIPAAYLP